MRELEDFQNAVPISCPCTLFALASFLQEGQERMVQAGVDLCETEQEREQFEFCETCAQVWRENKSEENSFDLGPVAFAVYFELCLRSRRITEMNTCDIIATLLSLPDDALRLVKHDFERDTFAADARLEDMLK